MCISPNRLRKLVLRKFGSVRFSEKFLKLRTELSVQFRGVLEL